MTRFDMPKLTVSRIAVVGGAVCILLAVIAGAQATALPHPQRGDPVQVIRLVERIAGQPVFDDGGAPGPGVGDRLVFSADLFDDRDRAVGRDGADCVVVRVDRSQPAATQQVVECMVTVELAGGQITFQGLAQGTDNHFAVTGGTGIYRHARGEAHAVDRVPLQEANITIKVVR